MIKNIDLPESKMLQTKDEKHKYLLVEFVLPELQVVGKIAQVRIILDHLQAIVGRVRLYGLHRGRLGDLGFDCSLLFRGSRSAKNLIKNIFFKSDVICSLSHR